MGATTERRPPRHWFIMGEEEEDPRPGLFVILAHLSLARGFTSISTETPEGEVFHVPIDDQWEAFLNPHQEPAVFALENGMSGQVEGFTAWINYNGWLWALADYHQQVFGEHPNPEGANLRSFVRAVLDAWPDYGLDELDPDGLGPQEGWP